MLYQFYLGGKKMKRISLIAVMVLFCGLFLGCAGADLAIKAIGYTAQGIKAADSIGKKSDDNLSKLMWDPGQKRYYREDKNGNRIYE